MQSITCEVSFIAAHRVEGHPKCGRLHGHNYRVVITAIRPKTNLNAMGFIIDFSDLKRIAKTIVGVLDHKYIVSHANIEAGCPYASIARQRDEAVLLPIHQTSAEYLSDYLKQMLSEQLVEEGFAHIAVAEVQVWETPKAYATS